jgi:glycosyltransferase involved in cell wall biosynthesis
VLELVAMGAPYDRIEVVPLGMPKLDVRDLYESKVDAGWNPAEKIVTTFGFVEPHKGILELIEAMPEVRKHIQARLMVLGGPHPSNDQSQDYLNSCKRRANELGIANAVSFVEGFISDENLDRYLHASDVIAMNYQSHRYEGSAATALALASGRPVISSSVPSFEYPNALTFKLTKEFTLTRAIIIALTHPFVAAALLQNVKHYEKSAGWDVVAKRINEVYCAVSKAEQQPDYDLLKYYAGHPDNIYDEPLQQERVRWLKSKAEGLILEIGPATGYVASYVGVSTAVDINRGRLAVCSALRPGIRFMYGNVVEGLPFSDKEFDQVHAPEILEHVDFEQAVVALRECARVGKRVILTMPNADNPEYNPDLVHNIEHRWLVNRQFIDRLLREAGCDCYELDASPDLDFYYLDIRTTDKTAGVRIHERAALLPTRDIDPGEPIHVGVDASALEDPSSRKRGVGRYTFHQIMELIAVRPHWQFSILGVENRPDVQEIRELASHANSRYVPWNEILSVKPDILYLTHPTGALDHDIIQLCTMPEMSDLMVACTFYDLIPLMLGDAYLKLAPGLHEQYISQLRALRERIDLFLCISQSTAQDLQAHLQAPLARLRIIHAGATDHFTKKPPQSELDKVLGHYGLKPSAFLLSVGTPDYRKNAAGMFLALARARELLKQDLQLVMAGHIQTTQINELHKLERQCGLAIDSVIYSGYLEEDALSALYHSASALLYPSLYEGFGLQILEAMSAGLPVIAGNNSSQPEVAGDAVLLVNARNIEEIAEAIVRLQQDPSLRAELSRKSLLRSKQFTWKKVAEKTAVYLYENLMRCKKRSPTRTPPEPAELLTA